MGNLFQDSFMDVDVRALSCWNNTIAVGFATYNIVILSAITGSQELFFLGM